MNNSFRRQISWFAGFLVFLTITSSAVDENTALPKEIVVGMRAPEFTLKDQNDREFSLKTMLGKGPVAVVFIRSIDWCTYCQLQTVQLSENLAEIQAGGGQVVMVCYDAPSKVKKFTLRRKVNIPVLSDADSKTIDAYAMRALKGDGDKAGASQHGAFVIDKSGIVRAKPLLTSFEGPSAVVALVNTLKEASKQTDPKLQQP
jgi:peroxiredoxin